MSLSQAYSLDRRSFDLVSVDLFDTLLLRDHTTQHQRFAEVAKILSANLHAAGHDVDARTLLELRLRVHGLAYQATSIERPDGDADVLRMIEIQASLIGIDRSLVPLILSAELEVERRHLAPNRPLLRLLASLRAAGNRIIAISDMYLSTEALEGLVREIVGFSPVDKIYVSCDFDLTKRSGQLFAKVAAQENVQPRRMLHLGDDKHSDVAMARAAGCQAILLGRPDGLRVIKAIHALLNPPPQAVVQK
jgi:FMN phosphatase YigB (HAD superfamily)